LIDAKISLLQCQIQDILNRLPIKFIIGDVNTIKNNSMNNLNSYNSLSSPDAFSPSSSLLQNDFKTHIIDLNPGYSNNGVYLGGNGNVTNSPGEPVKQNAPSLTKLPQLEIEHVSLPNVYLKFVFASAPQGDRGPKGIQGDLGVVGDTGPTGPQGPLGYNGKPPKYMW
jgi:hypothetical protein